LAPSSGYQDNFTHDIKPETVSYTSSRLSLKMHASVFEVDKTVVQTTGVDQWFFSTASIVG
jgi:hypothetical protein